MIAEFALACALRTRFLLLQFRLVQLIPSCATITEYSSKWQHTRGIGDFGYLAADKPYARTAKFRQAGRVNMDVLVLGAAMLNNCVSG